MKTLYNTNILAYNEWMKKNNRNVNDVSHCSHYKAWFKCSVCNYEWKSAIYNRSKGKGCPACSGRVVLDNNRFDIKYPHIALEWYNNNKTPDKFTLKSNFVAHWKCKKCNFIWKARISDRTRGSGCPSCAGQVVNDKNRLSFLTPSSINDWDYTKNKKLPSDFAFKSNKKVWWLCNICNYNWFGTIYAYSKSGCPKCNGFIANNKNNLKNDLFLMKFWSLKNILSPDKIHRRSSKKVVWFCKKCHYEWKMSPHRFSSYRGCPKCSTGSRVSKKALKWLQIIDNDALPEQRIKINNKYIYVDGYNNEKGIVYEFFGDYWHGNPRVYNLEQINKHNKISFGELYKRTLKRIENIKHNGFKLIYIWESEFLE